MFTSTKNILGRRISIAFALALTLGASPAAFADTGYCLPDENYWSLSLCTGTLGSGNCISSDNESPTTGVAWSNLAAAGINNAAASYVVCNNTGTGYSFLVEVYQDTNYTTSLQNNTLYLPAHSCHFVDLVTANVASSIKVTP